MMKILFTRHGESEANVQQIISNRDLPHSLTEIGSTQAKDLAETLAISYAVQSIKTSPILRARETAVIVGDALGLPITLHSALREFDCGQLEGRADKEAWAAHQAVVRAWNVARDFDRSIPPDGESFNDMKARFIPFITSLIEANSDVAGDILLISHGGLLHHMLPLVLVNVDQAFIRQHPMGNCHLVETHLQNGRLYCTNWAGICPA